MLTGVISFNQGSQRDFHNKFCLAYDSSDGTVW